MIPVKKLIELFGQMYQEHWSYILGSAKQGCVDCSGAFVYAYKELGGGTIEHGSNSIFRKRIGNYTTTPKPGYAAFKVRAWSDTSNNWYGQAPGDVYHIGLVDATGEHVLNAKGEKYGFSRDSLKGWDYFAPLKAVDYNTVSIGVTQTKGDEQMSVLYKAIVATENDPLRVREWAKTGTILGHVPKGREVEVLTEEKDGWVRIRYNELVGYVSADYLTPVETDTNIGGKTDVRDANVGESGTDNNVLTTTTLVNEEGMLLTIVGKWRVPKD